MSDDDRKLHAALATFRDVEPAPPLEEDEEAPKFSMTGKRAALFALFVLGALAFLYFVLPQLGDVRDTWGRLSEGEPGWLFVALLMQIASMGCYMVVFQDVHVPPGFPIKLKETYQITMASLAATRLFAAGGAGGVALTAWALRRAGLPRKDVATRMIAFLALTYAIYMLALIVCGFGLRWGIFPGKAPFALTIIPAYIGIFAFLVFFAIAFLPKDLERRITGYQPRSTRAGKLLGALATGPARLGDGVRFALRAMRHPDLALLGTVGWWGFNIGVLYACFEAFGHAPPVAVMVQAYFVGMLGNLLPLPGGIGGVDAGMYGTFVAFGEPGSLALISVLTYRLFAFWLPSLPGAIAYFQLRRTVARWRTERPRNASVSPGTIQSEVSPS
ncbi:MAG TPA: lysylphosphatidylglycerol synthase transmembrane domain-containing protein [Solirubrobacteraceae bacterium]